MSEQKRLAKLVILKSDDDDEQEQYVSAKAQRRTMRGSDDANGRRDLSAVTLTRSKALLLAALRVWDLKHRVVK